MGNILPDIATDLIERIDGPLHFRFIVQPLIAAAFAFRDGRRDARGEPPGNPKR